MRCCCCCEVEKCWLLEAGSGFERARGKEDKTVSGMNFGIEEVGEGGGR